MAVDVSDSGNKTCMVFVLLCILNLCLTLRRDEKYKTALNGKIQAAENSSLIQGTW